MTGRSPTDLRALLGLAAHCQPGQFVTGQLARIELDTQTATIVNAGHPWPLRLRHGKVDEIELAIDTLFGINPGRAFRVQRLPPEPGDQLDDDATVLCLDWAGGSPRPRSSTTGADPRRSSPSASDSPTR